MCDNNYEMVADLCYRFVEVSQDRVCRTVFAQICKAAYDYCMDADDDPFCEGFPERMPEFPQTADELPICLVEMLPRREYLGDIRLGLGYTTIDSAKTAYNSIINGRPLPPRPPIPQDEYQQQKFFEHMWTHLKLFLRIIAEKADSVFRCQVEIWKIESAR